MVARYAHSAKNESNRFKSFALEHFPEQTLAFNASNQHLFSLDTLSGELLSRLVEGVSPGVAAQEFKARHGCTNAQGRRFVTQLLQSLRRGGACTVQPQNKQSEARRSKAATTPGLNAQGTYRQSLSLCGVDVCLSYGDAEIAAMVAPTFKHLEKCVGPDAAAIQIRRTRAGWEGAIAGRPCLATTTVQQIAPIAKRLVAELVFYCANYDLAIHAASVRASDRSILIAGRSGIGKTTLAIALSERGLPLMSDDCTLFATDGNMLGLPLAVSLKTTAQALEYADAAICDETHLRGDGVAFRYAVPTQRTDLPAPLGGVVFPCRKPGIPLRTEPVAAADAIHRLLDLAYARRRHLTKEGFLSFASAVRGANCLDVHYSEAAEAAAFLKQELS